MRERPAGDFLLDGGNGGGGDAVLDDPDAFRPLGRARRG